MSFIPEDHRQAQRHVHRRRVERLSSRNRADLQAHPKIKLGEVAFAYIQVESDSQVREREVLVYCTPLMADYRSDSW